ncbi:MAG: inositol monophosphatase [Gemmatimonadaceae bacterium]|nr:inositol monophosphatase [Gemmatimonadaceae bacterium]
MLLTACTAAAQAGATYIRSRTADLATIDWQEKARADFVSEVDLGAEERITNVLHAAVPGAVVVGEERSPGLAPNDHEIAFIVDPLDGTTNFLHGYPQYAVSIAAVAEGGLVAGIVLDVPRGITYAATRGGGATRDGTPIRVSRLVEPARALVGTGFPFKDPQRIPEYLPSFSRVVGQVAGVRRAGAAALDLADVAAGRFDGFWELMLAPWDHAAGTLLIREAGGRVSDLAGNELRVEHTPVVASNGVLHEWLLAQLRPSAPFTIPS